jgi:vacuolar-type H+-ATPase catalytic subunit A/Vma1
MSKTPNPLAFPAAPYEANVYTAFQEGMTLRDYFAAKAMAAALSAGSSLKVRELAEAAYIMADAMLAARMKDQSK